MALRIGVVGAAEPGRSLPLAAGGVLLALVVADSTVRAGWVVGAVALPAVAVLGALAGVVTGLSRLRGSVALALACAPAPLAAIILVRSQAAPAGRPLDWSAAGQLAREALAGVALADPVVLQLLLHALFWLLGAWLAWGVLRRRQPLLAVAPAGAALATNVLNFPDGQDAYVFWFIVLTLAVLLWSTYHASLAAARRHRVELADNARWDFWERGAVAAAGLVALGVLAPPLSASDRTLDIQNGVSDAWGRITHSGAGGAGTSAGFSADARLGGALTHDSGVVFTYTVVGQAPGPSYFRGLVLQPQREEWAFVPQATAVQEVARGDEAAYAETYVGLARATYALDVQRPPRVAPDLILSPGQFASVDRNVELLESSRRGLQEQPGPALFTVDEATAASGRGSYRVQVDQSVATETELRDDSVGYPAWARPYLGLPFGYRSPATEARIHELALRVTAGATNPYDDAAAVEQYLRTNFAYTLTPGPPPAGVDVEENFLFSSRAGYCQYFATAMADMLRSLGVPTRLVNGYGPGAYDASHDRFVVTESDSHTWPEVYFPSYGWIPFEPTPDGVYTPITRGGTAGVDCSSGACQSDSGTPLATPSAAPTPRPRQEPAGPSVPAPTGGPRLPSLRTWTPVGALLLVLLVLLYVLASRFLRPQTVAGVWHRVILLLQLAGVRPRTGETPIEFGDRVAGAFPETAAGMRQLAGDFAVAAYAPAGLAELRKPAVLAGWGALRPLLLRRVAARVRRRS